MGWWKVFVDKLSGRAQEEGVVGPRRRAEVRYAYQAKLEAKCSSWPAFEALFTGDVSASGMFVPTAHEAEIGEKIQLKLTLPDGQAVEIGGSVVAVITAEIAARSGRPRGLGIRLDPLRPEVKRRFEALLTAARDAQPAPADSNFDVDVDIDEHGSLPKPMPRPDPAGPPAPPPRREDAGDLVIAEEAVPVRAATQPTAPAAPGKAAAALARAAPKKHTRIIGIDMGTTYTAVAAAVGNRVAILPRQDGDRSTPSVISFPHPREILVGAEARRRLATDPKHTVQSPKRLLGRKFDDRTIEQFLCTAAWQSERGPDDSVLIDMWGEKYAVTQLCGYILAEAKESAERALKEAVDMAVITVPVSFDEPRVRLLRRAAQLARLEVVATIDEPSAAALANRYQPGFGGIVGVYDFGGGTFDFSLVDVSGGDFRVLATAGDAWLGGDDFDIALAEAVANQIQRMHGVDLRKAVVDWQRVLFACEKAKRNLTLSPQAEIHVPELLRTATGMIDLSFRIDRPTLERACAGVIERSLNTCTEALELLDMKPEELSAIYLSGGTTYIPAVRSALARRFPVPIKTGVPPEHAVCIGAGIHAAQLELQGRATLDPHLG